MAQTIHRSRIMRISWDIQKQKHHSRSHSLHVAWAIFSNEDVVVHYLTRKLNCNRPLPVKTEHQYSIFNHQS